MKHRLTLHGTEEMENVDRLKFGPPGQRISADEDDLGPFPSPPFDAIITITPIQFAVNHRLYLELYNDLPTRAPGEFICGEYDDYNNQGCSDELVQTMIEYYIDSILDGTVDSIHYDVVSRI